MVFLLMRFIPTQVHYPTRNTHASLDLQHIIQMMSRLENRLDTLIKLIEDNNQLLQSIEQQKHIISSGGGSVIV
ncbi:hypothetical protein BF28_5875 (plasmid) [Bacillus cereus E33L]|uniref:YkzH n=1 Tax=Bacillus cereus (strain ZK / E33L) TaxID=288681 RepID=Q4V168_BACCZ|nr:hypothetical protein pE33L466_0398 [Bacillus cereus E33L]AJI26258.1 hypothetical protein BF28_5875 [Bacillus cereus E33L]